MAPLHFGGAFQSGGPGRSIFRGASVATVSGVAADVAVVETLGALVVAGASEVGAVTVVVTAVSGPGARESGDVAQAAAHPESMAMQMGQPGARKR